MMFDKNDVLLRATGMWPHLLQQLTSVDSAVFNKKHQPCPCCGGEDRFRFDDKRNHSGDGGYICNPEKGCGAGDGLSLYIKLTGFTFGEAITNLGNALNMIPVERVNVIKKEIASKASLPKNAKTFTEESELLLKSCDGHKKTPPFFIKHSKGIHRTRILNGYDAVYTVTNAAGCLVNAAIVDPYGDVAFVGGEETAGGFTFVGEKTQRWYVCADIKTAIWLHEKTGCRTICTWSDNDDPYFMRDALNGLASIGGVELVVWLSASNCNQLPFLPVVRGVKFAIDKTFRTVDLADFCSYAFPKILNTNSFTMDELKTEIRVFSTPIAA